MHESDESRIGNNIQNLTNSFGNWVVDNNLDDQWSNFTRPGGSFDRKANRLNTAIGNEVNRLDNRNNITGWAQDHRISQRFDNMGTNIENHLSVTNAIQMPEDIQSESYTLDEIVIFTAFGVLVIAALIAATQKEKKDKLLDHEDAFIVEFQQEA